MTMHEFDEVYFRLARDAAIAAGVSNSEGERIGANVVAKYLENLAAEREFLANYSNSITWVKDHDIAKGLRDRAVRLLRYVHNKAGGEV